MQRAFERLLDLRTRWKNPPGSPESDEETLALAQLAWRLQRLQTVAAPEHLRRTGLARAFAAHPDLDDAGLVHLISRLHRLRSVSAPRGLRATGLGRALGTAPPRQGGRVVPLSGRHEPWVAAFRRVAATAAAVFLLAYGTFAVSAASLPDSPFYPVKLLVEDARVAVAAPDDKPLLYVEQASRRIQETDALIGDGRIGAAERTAGDAAKRLESAQVAAQQAPAPQVSDAIDSTLAQYRSVSESLASRGGSSPTIGNGQTAIVARVPAALAPTAVIVAQVAEADEPSAEAAAD